MGHPAGLSPANSPFEAEHDCNFTTDAEMVVVPQGRDAIHISLMMRDCSLELLRIKMKEAAESRRTNGRAHPNLLNYFSICQPPFKMENTESLFTRFLVQVQDIGNSSGSGHG